MAGGAAVVIAWRWASQPGAAPAKLKAEEANGEPVILWVGVVTSMSRIIASRLSLGFTATPATVCHC